jgi:antitoxin YefM
MAITATAARKDFYRLIEKVNLDNDEIEITSKGGSAHLLRSPANAARLAAAAQQVREGRATPHELHETD